MRRSSNFPSVETLVLGTLNPTVIPLRASDSLPPTYHA